MVVSSEKFDPVAYELGADQLKRNVVDHWILGLNKHGSVVSVTEDQILESCPGSLSLRSLTRPFQGQSSTVEMIFVYLPRDLFHAEAARFDALNNRAMPGPLCGLLADFLLALERRLPFLSPDELPRAAISLRAMISTCLAPTRQSLDMGKAELAQTLLERIRRYIRAHVSAPSLSPEELSRVFQVSRSQLYRLFEKYGGVAQEIRRIRLDASFAALNDHERIRPIKKIAEEFGFASADDYTRAFRRRFGQSPREARHMRAVPPACTLPSESGFSSWMQQLGTSYSPALTD